MQMFTGLPPGQPHSGTNARESDFGQAYPYASPIHLQETSQ
jgi:hypothetical protein